MKDYKYKHSDKIMNKSGQLLRSLNNLEIPRDNLILYMDSNNINSYPGSGDYWYDLTHLDFSVELTTGVEFDTSDNSFQLYEFNDGHIKNEYDPYLLLYGSTLIVVGYRDDGDSGISAMARLGRSGIFFTDNNHIRTFRGDDAESPEISINNPPNPTMVAHSLSSDNIMKTYVDGELKDERTTNVYSTGINNFSMGDDDLTYYPTSDPSTYMRGKFYLLLIYNRALSDNEIYQIYDSYNTHRNTSIDSNCILYLDSNNPYSYKGDSGKWKDLTSKGNDVNLENHFDIDLEDVMIRESFKGVGYMNLYNNSYFHKAVFDSPPGSQLTISMWIKTDFAASFNTSILTLGNRPETINNKFYLQCTPDGKISFRDYDGGWGFSISGTNNTPINDSKWHFVNFVKNGTSGKYYFDGQPDGTETAASDITYRADDFVIGIDYRLDPPSVLFKGLIGSVLIYDRILSDTEILNNYNSEKDKYVNTFRIDKNKPYIPLDGLVLHLDTDNEDSIVQASPNQFRSLFSRDHWYDLSGYNNDVKTISTEESASIFLYSTYNYYNGIYDGLYVYNERTRDGYKIPISSSIDFDTNDNFTMIAVGLIDEFANQGTFFGRGVRGGSYGIRASSIDTVNMGCRSTNIFWFDGHDFKINSDPNKPYTMVSYVYNSSNQEHRAYIDGILEAKESISSDFINNQQFTDNYDYHINSGNAVIGGDNQTEHFEGRYKFILMYNRALSEDEIYNIYRKYQTFRPKADPGIY